MKTQKYFTSVALLLIFICFTTFSLAGNGGSVYSRYGLGDLCYFSSSRAGGMGSASISVLSANSIDGMNPAAWTQINRTRFSVGVLYEGFSTKDNSTSAYFSEASFGGFMMALPIATKLGMVLGAGITPYSRINYNIVSPESQGGFDYTVQHIGEGGLSQAHLGFSVIIAGDIHLGAKLNYYFGTLNYSTRQTIGSEWAEVLRSTKLDGLGFTIGTVYTGLKQLLDIPKEYSIDLGMVFNTTSYLASKKENYYAYNTTLIVTRDTAFLPDGKVRLPYSLGGGISFLTGQYILAADFFYQNWNRYTVDEIHPSEIRDSYRFSIGGELLPKHDPSSTFFQHIAYRAGFFYNSSYFKLKNEPINEIGVTFGVGIPLIGDTRIDIVPEYCFRGTTNQQLLQDKIIRINMTLSGGELWFVRPEHE